MPSKKKSRRREAPPPDREPQITGETRTADAATVAWTVSVTTVLMCDVAAVIALLYARSHPEAHTARVFSELMLFAAAAVGAFSLIMLPVVFRVRRVPPPQAFAVFGVCVAAAPLVAVIARAMR